jgi:pre-mRNA-processing factor 6
LFLLLSRLQEKVGIEVKARSTLDRARTSNPKNPVLWLESIRLERRAGNESTARQLMAIALQECPTSGLLWSDRILNIEQRTHRKPRALEAIKKCENDAPLFVTLARLFWQERKLDKADNWFTKAIVLDSDYGDGWAWYWKFLERHGTEEKKGEVLSKVHMAEPKHGEVWQSVNKDPKNVGKSVEEILKLVAAQLE